MLARWRSCSTPSGFRCPATAAQHCAGRLWAVAAVALSVAVRAVERHRRETSAAATPRMPTVDDHLRHEAGGRRRPG